LRVGGSDSTVRVRNAETGTEILALKGHLDTVSSLAAAPDGRRVVTEGYDDSVKVWDAVDWRADAQAGHRRASAP
jgi:WD40 repeat protein